MLRKKSDFGELTKIDVDLRSDLHSDTIRAGYQLQWVVSPQ